MRWASIITLAVTACTAADNGDRYTVVRDSGGITIVESQHAAWNTRDAWRLSANPAVEIGVVEGDTHYQLFRANSSLRLPDGTIVVANAGTQELRWFDPQGTYVRTAGGRGGGPGEFEGLGWVAQLGEDSIIAYDQRHSRVSVFDTEGEFGRAQTLGQRGLVLGMFADGSLLLTSRAMGADDLSEGLRRRSDGLYRYANTGEFLDSLGLFPGTERILEIQRTGTGSSVDSTVYAVTDSAFYVGTQDRYAITVHNPDGGLIGSVRRQQDNLTVTPAHIEAFIEQSLTEATDDVERRRSRARLSYLPYPESMPAYGRIRVDTDGNLWVEESCAPGDQRPRWTVFDSQHRMLGTVATPVNFTIHQIGSDFVLGRWTDDFDVEHIHLYELEKT
jgi:hypothetical protein